MHQKPQKILGNTYNSPVPLQSIVIGQMPPLFNSDKAASTYDCDAPHMLFVKHCLCCTCYASFLFVFRCFPVFNRVSLNSQPFLATFVLVSFVSAAFRQAFAVLLVFVRLSYLPTYLPSLPTYLPPYLLVYLPTHLPIYIILFLLVYLLRYLPTYFSCFSYILIYSPTNLLIYLLTY